MKNFVDIKSKVIYDDLKALVETNDLNKLSEAIKVSGIEPDPAYEAFQELKENKCPVYLYGLGRDFQENLSLEKLRKDMPGYLFYPWISDVRWNGYVDKKVSSISVGGVKYKVMSPQELSAIKGEYYVYIASTTYEAEIRKELIELGIKGEYIKKFPYGNTQVYEKKQYFDDFLKPLKESIVIDGGCFRCDAIERFIEWNSTYGYERIISFEPDRKNYELCKGIIREKNWKNVQLIHAGLSNEQKTVMIRANGDATSLICENGEDVTSLTTIDEIVQNGEVSFIKLDVEGFELKTLQGAERCIRRCHPRMAISLYHQKNDIVEIPQYILSLHEDYKFYLRIYSNAFLEVVLYAI